MGDAGSMGGAGGGEANTASNVGTSGEGTFDAKIGTDLQFRKLNPLSSKITIAADVANKKIDFNIPDASNTVKGAAELADDGESSGNVVVQGNDSRLYNSRVPSGTAGGDLAGTYPSPTVALNAIGTTKLADMAANTIRANATASTADPADFSVGTDTVVGRASGNIVAATVATSQITNAAVTYAKIQNVAATSRVLGRITTGAGVIEELTGSQITPLLDAGTTTTKGTVELATSGENAANVVVQGNDSRLSDARSPTTHATTHKSGQGDVIKLDEFGATTDITTLNASTTAHGLLPKLSNVSTQYLNGVGSWAALTPAENTGTATGTANGSTTVFNIAHSLGSTPYSAFVQVSSVVASTVFYSFTYDSTNIVVTFASAPSSGTITFQWRAVA